MLIPEIFRLGAILSIFLLMLYMEYRRPLRRTTQPKATRTLTNLAIASTSAIALRFTFYPVVIAIAFWVEDRGYGLLHSLNLPHVITTILSIVVLDWTLYYWHLMLHKVPFLWRFHNVHHVDLDLDSSTAFRFHFGELMISTFFRSAQIFVFGISPFNLGLFELMITSFALFHHSNLRLPAGLEKVLSRLLITPRLHGIHHSTVRSETDSNFGTIFSGWDFIHGTFKSDVPQDSIVIGVPAYRNPKELSITGLLKMPFMRQRPWPYDSRSKTPESQ